jgi:hypothetical protein
VFTQFKPLLAEVTEVRVSSYCLHSEQRICRFWAIKISVWSAVDRIAVSSRSATMSRFLVEPVGVNVQRHRLPWRGRACVAPLSRWSERTPPGTLLCAADRAASCSGTPHPQLGSVRWRAGTPAARQLELRSTPPALIGENKALAVLADHQGLQLVGQYRGERHAAALPRLGCRPRRAAGLGD